MIAEVIVDINHSEVDRIFDYKFDNPLVKIGSRVSVPFGNKKIDGFVIGIKEKSQFSIEKLKEIYSVVDDIPVLNKETLHLFNYISKNYFVTKALSLRLFLPAEMRKGKVKEKFTKFVYLKKDIDVNAFIDKLNKNAIKQRDFLLSLFNEKEMTLTNANARFGASAVKGAINKGIVLIEERQDFRSPYSFLDKNQDKKIILTNSQQNAVDSVINTNKFVSLIFGVTGSGKTEIYLNLIDKTIKENKTAIFLVPEISLTPQMLKQLRARFGEKAAILHSGLSAGERFDEWWRLKSGEAKIAIGARSAIFAPLENVGLVIIDEEHDSSYLSETTPRYNTIDVALERVKLTNGKLVLGSATPSIDTFLKAQNGEYNLIELKERINKRPLPIIEIADMRKEVRRGNNTPFSSLLKEELKKCLDNGNQAILFLNQRGYSKNIICTECGHVIKCKNCDVSLTYHKEDNSLLCHYCGAKYKMVDACPECGSKFIRFGGVGTERIVYELKELFPKANILRYDRDTTQNKDGHFKILNEFSEKKADILVGTQMVAKGHDFPNVTLVGILDADMSLYFSDFRSEERTYQLLTQVAGRSGRADDIGKVVLQTYSPENPTLNYAIKYDYLGLYKHAISIRKATGFPPFSNIVRILISAVKEEDAIGATKSIYEEINAIYKENRDEFYFFGHMKAPLKRLQNKYRFQILMRINRENVSLIEKFFEISNKYNDRKVFIGFEVNPNNLT